MSSVSTAQMVEDIRESARAVNGVKLSEWEEEFMDSVEDRVDRGKTLTSKQLESLESIWDRV